ncbi:MAG: Crp/Fnr family transcriptional regulator [Chitinophagales bacterium]
MKDFLKTLNILTEEESQQIDSLTHKKYISKNDFLIRNGEICNEIVFIKSGILRSFYISEDGEEITNCISFKNDLMSAYSSFISQSPTDENIQALYDTELEFIYRKDLMNLYQNSIHWERLGRVLAEMQYVLLENRLASFQKHNAKQRYNQLLKNHPNYIQFIPLKDLASFLGISKRHLSRLRKEI